MPTLGFCFGYAALESRDTEEEGYNSALVSSRFYFRWEDESNQCLLNLAVYKNNLWSLLKIQN